MLLTFTVATMTTVAAANISVGDLSFPENVIGRLGKPLGTQTILVGGYPPRPTMGLPLAVSAIDDKPLDKPIGIFLEGRNGESSGVKIERGKVYRLEGYESGRFASEPMWLNHSEQQPFQFYSFFVVTKVLEVKDAAAPAGAEPTKSASTP